MDSNPEAGKDQSTAAAGPQPPAKGCIGCAKQNGNEQSHCGFCGKALDLGAFITDQIKSHISTELKDKELVEYESAAKIVSRAGNWARNLFFFPSVILAVVLAVCAAIADFRVRSFEAYIDQQEKKISEKSELAGSLTIKIEELSKIAKANATQIQEMRSQLSTNAELVKALFSQVQTESVSSGNANAEYLQEDPRFSAGHRLCSAQIGSHSANRASSARSPSLSAKPLSTQGQSTVVYRRRPGPDFSARNFIRSRQHQIRSIQKAGKAGRLDICRWRQVTIFASE